MKRLSNFKKPTALKFRWKTKKGEKIQKIRKKNRNKNQITPLIPVCQIFLT